MTEEHTPEMPPMKIAFVIDGQVVDVLHTDERLASIFLSNPVIIDATEWITNNPKEILFGGTWDGTTFTGAPQEERAIVE
jgi:hypothetical protein